MKDSINRERLAKMVLCMRLLHLNGVLTDAEEDKVFKRIQNFQDKYQVEISDKQLESVNITYQD